MQTAAIAALSFFCCCVYTCLSWLTCTFFLPLAHMLFLWMLSALQRLAMSLITAWSSPQATAPPSSDRRDCPLSADEAQVTLTPTPVGTATQQWPLSVAWTVRLLCQALLALFNFVVYPLAVDVLCNSVVLGIMVFTVVFPVDFAVIFPVDFPMPMVSSPRLGFVNLGNTCYMNAVLQAMLCLDTFTQSIQIKSWMSSVSTHAAGVMGKGHLTELMAVSFPCMHTSMTWSDPS